MEKIETLQTLTYFDKSIGKGFEVDYNSEGILYMEEMYEGDY